MTLEEQAMILGHIRQSMYLCKSKYVGFFYYQKTGGFRIMRSDLSIFEQMGGTYTLGEDGMYYPDLKLPTDEEPRYGKYGRIRKTFLQKHRYGLYLEFLLNSQLESDLSRGDYTKRQDKISDRDVK